MRKTCPPRKVNERVRRKRKRTGKYKLCLEQPVLLQIYRNKTSHKYDRLNIQTASTPTEFTSSINSENNNVQVMPMRTNFIMFHGANIMCHGSYSEIHATLSKAEHFSSYLISTITDNLAPNSTPEQLNFAISVFFSKRKAVVVPIAFFADASNANLSVRTIDNILSALINKAKAELKLSRFGPKDVELKAIIFNNNADEEESSSYDCIAKQVLWHIVNTIEVFGFKVCLGQPTEHCSTLYCLLPTGVRRSSAMIGVSSVNNNTGVKREEEEEAKLLSFHQCSALEDYVSVILNGTSQTFNLFITDKVNKRKEVVIPSGYAVIFKGDVGQIGAFES